MSVQLPPNSTGSVVATLTSGGVEYQKTIQADGVAPTVLQSVLAPGAAAASEVGVAVVRAHPVDGSKATYRCGGTFNPGTGATTNLLQIIGSASKVVRVNKVTLSGTIATTAEVWSISLNKQSAADSGGTAVAATLVPNDSANAAATAAVAHYTAAPTAGAVIGSVGNRKMFLSISPAQTQEVVFDFGKLGQAIVLRGVAEALAVYAAGVTPAHASSVCYEVEFTEE